MTVFLFLWLLVDMANGKYSINRSSRGKIEKLSIYPPRSFSVALLREAVSLVIATASLSASCLVMPTG